MKNGNIIGIILIGLGVLIFLGGSAVVLTSGATGGGAVLGVVIALFVAAPLVGGGIFLITHSKADAAKQVDAKRRRKILDVVKTQGQVDISDLVFELDSNTQQVRDDIYKLVGMGLFTGYINWDKGTLYSQEASQIRGSNKCPNCGGELALGGKGVITCQYCGTDIFL